MKNMKQYITILLLPLICCSSYGQTVDSCIHFNKPSVELLGDSLHIKFGVYARQLTTNYRIEIKPMLHSKAQTMQLIGGTISGRKKSLSELRKELSNPKRVPSLGGFSASAGDTLRYSVMVPYAEWMNGSSLVINAIKSGCCRKELLLPVELMRGLTFAPIPATNPIPVKIVEPNLSRAEVLVVKETFIRPVSDFEIDKRRSDFFRKDDALRLYFRQNKDEVDYSDSDNIATMERLKSALETFASDSVLNVSKVLIVGSASVEGRAEYNAKLADRRAECLVKITKKYGIRSDQIHIINLGEGWDELRHMVEQSSEIPNKEEILNIIDNVPVSQYREKRLMELGKGEPYRWMLKYLFPSLRSTSYYKIYYKEK